MLSVALFCLGCKIGRTVPLCQYFDSFLLNSGRLFCRFFVQALLTRMQIENCEQLRPYIICFHPAMSTIAYSIQWITYGSVLALHQKNQLCTLKMYNQFVN